MAQDKVRRSALTAGWTSGVISFHFSTPRDGHLPTLTSVTTAFNQLLQVSSQKSHEGRHLIVCLSVCLSHQVMVHPNPVERPTASELVMAVCPSAQKSKVCAGGPRGSVFYSGHLQAQLCKELNEERFKNEILQK